ncbi:uncharacterized protein LOC132757108 [Ruditapes philippinarum]|uniref:uncharacterized protein LOC132757108 n=1 Tax=Ruditapes philippinarum TaxID=129788 RepID=UPI00295BAF83|nr:uncharacterized protein LOC132757108 [Ruditapes philippinarum]
MAVSGRKAVAPIKGWFDSNINHFCDPCKTDGQNVKARGYCEDCQEYLCSSCFSSHRKTKASKHHKLHERSDATNTSILDDKCPFHNTEIVKFFCPRHEELGCHDCMVLKHRTCDLDYIPDTCKGIADSKEYDDTLKMLELKLQAAGNLEREISDKTTEADECFNQALKDIDDFEYRIINRIKEMKTKAVENAKQINESNKRALKTRHEDCSKMLSDVKQLQASLKDNKTSGKEREIYIAVKKAKSLAVDEIRTEVLTEIRKLKTTYTFKRNEEMEYALFKNISLGILETKNRSVSSLQHLRNIKVKTFSDGYECSIAGCSLIPPDKVLLADESNKKLKLFNINNDRLINEREENGEPCCVVHLSQDEVAVAMLRMKAVQIFKTDDDLSLVRTVQLGRQCCNVTYNQGKVYVVCWNPESVLVLDLYGTIQTDIPLSTDNIHMTIPSGIAVSADSKYIYVSDYNSNIVRLTNNGSVSSIYKEDKKIKSPSGILRLEDGSLLVCCRNSNTVYRISEDFKTGFNVLDKIVAPKSICIDYNGDKVYIGCDNATFNVCKVGYQK